MDRTRPVGKRIEEDFGLMIIPVNPGPKPFDGYEGI